jgi:hypothetical protein
MRTLICTWIVCVAVAYAGGVQAAPKAKPTAAPKVDARAKYKTAVQLDDSGEAEKALAAIDEGLALAPNDLPLLFLKGTVLLKQRDYPGALAAYQAYLDAGAKGAPRRTTEKIINDLEAVKTTFLDITLANGPAPIYLDSKTQGVFCTAAPSCNKAVLPGPYRVIADRAGFDRWTGSVTVERGKTTKLAATLVEKPSLLTVRVAQPGARVTVDDAAYEAPAKVAAGTHRIVVTLAGHGDARLEAAAHEGKPVELDVALTPLVAIHVAPPGAQLLLDGKPVVAEAGSIGVPPGSHALVASAAGFREQRIEIPAERAADYQITVELPIVEAVKVVKALPAPGRFTFRRKIGIAVGGVGVAALAGGVVLGLQSRQLDHDTYALCPSPSTPCGDAREANDLNQRGRSRALQANIAYGVAGGAAIAAAVLWLTGAPESPGEPRVAVTPQLGAVTGLDVAVRF